MYNVIPQADYTDRKMAKTMVAENIKKSHVLHMINIMVVACKIP